MISELSHLRVKSGRCVSTTLLFYLTRVISIYYLLVLMNSDNECWYSNLITTSLIVYILEKSAIAFNNS